MTLLFNRVLRVKFLGRAQDGRAWVQTRAGHAFRSHLSELSRAGRRNRPYHHTSPKAIALQ